MKCCPFSLAYKEDLRTLIKKKNRKLGHIKNKMFVYVLEVIILMTFTYEKTAFLFINQVDLRGGGVTLTPPTKSSKHQSIV